MHIPPATKVVILQHVFCFWIILPLMHKVTSWIDS
jgi:hypothetical protein